MTCLLIPSNVPHQTEEKLVYNSRYRSASLSSGRNMTGYNKGRVQMDSKYKLNILLIYLVRTIRTIKM